MRDFTAKRRFAPQNMHLHKIPNPTVPQYTSDIHFKGKWDVFSGRRE